MKRSGMDRVQGFTLLELLLAISILALLSLLSWRTLDTLGKTEESTQQYSERWRQWQTALAQWQTDLDAIEPLMPPSSTGSTITPAFDGLVIQWTRRAPITATTAASPGWQVVAWSLQRDESGERHLARWASPPFFDRAALTTAWEAARVWARTPTAALQQQQTLLGATEDWQLLYFRGGAWSNPQSTGGSPVGIHLVLTLPGEAEPQLRQLQFDWVHPAHAVARDETD